MLRFCPKCNSLMIPKKINGKVYLVCTSCGYRIQLKDKIVLATNVSPDKHYKIGVIELGLRRVKKDEQEMYRDEYYSIFLDTYAEEYEEGSEE